MPDFTFDNVEAYDLSTQVPCTETFGEANIYPGFSNRLNLILDNLTVFVPAKRGRKRWLATISSSHDKQTQSWLEEDKAPKINKLKGLIVFFMQYMSEDVKPVCNTDLEIWLLYGRGSTYKPNFTDTITQ